MDVKFLSESPDDSNARATDLGIILEIKGKILAAANGDAEAGAGLRCHCGTFHAFGVRRAYDVRVQLCRSVHQELF